MTTVLDTKFSPVNIEERKNWDIRPGDTVRVLQKIKEGEKTRLQAFEGLVLARKHGTEPGATFTVRKVASGVGVERVFPLYSPVIEKVEILRRGKVRRAKLYYIREKAAKEVRRKMRQSIYVSAAVTAAEEEVAAESGEKNKKEEAKNDQPQENSTDEKKKE